MIGELPIVVDPAGTTAATAARVFGVPAARIRKWVFLGKIHRFPDGSLDPGCIAARLVLATEGFAACSAFHDRECHVPGMVR